MFIDGITMEINKKALVGVIRYDDKSGHVY